MGTCEGRDVICVCLADERLLPENGPGMISSIKPDD